MANCPKCGKHVAFVREQEVSEGMMGPRITAYVCADCDAILGFPVDMNEIERRVSAAIARATKRR